MMPTVSDLINDLGAGEMAKASTTFADLMKDKVNDALDDRKIELGRLMTMSPEEIEAEEQELEAQLGSEDEAEEVGTEDSTVDEDDTGAEDESAEVVDEVESAEEQEEVEADEDVQPAA